MVIGPWFPNVRFIVKHFSCASSNGLQIFWYCILIYIVLEDCYYMTVYVTCVLYQAGLVHRELYMESENPEYYIEFLFFGRICELLISFKY